MAKFTRNRAMRNLGSAANSTIKTTEKAAVGLARWATTDHSGMSRAMSSMPKRGFLDSLGYILTSFLVSIAGVFLSAGLMFLLIAFGVPFLLRVIF